jgi:hypothetical protein
MAKSPGADDRCRDVILLQTHREREVNDQSNDRLRDFVGLAQLSKPKQKNEKIKHSDNEQSERFIDAARH